MTIPFTWKREYSVFVGFTVCSVVLCVIVGGWVSSYKDVAFEKRQQAYEAQIEIKETERTEAIARAKLFEERAKELEAQVVINEAAIAAAGKRAEAIQEKIKNEDTEFVEAMAAVDTVVFSRCARIIHICEASQRLGYRPKSQPCICADE